MIKKTKVIFFLTLITFIAAMVFGEKTASGEGFYPPVPDKSKTLPANDGGPDGCDSTRFKCVMGGEAVLDKQTGLTWTRDTRFDNKSVSWQEAVNFCQVFMLGDKKDWRLATRDELITLLDTSKSNPAFPDGHPFKLRKGEGGGGYWTSTEYEDNNKYVWRVSSSSGKAGESLKIMGAGIWPVRDGN